MSNSTKLAVAPGPTVMEMRQEFAALQALKSELLREGVDYGKIPGADKPSLWKPGAEKILKRFMVHLTGIEIEDLSSDDCFRFRIRCIGSTPDGVVRGIGIGVCSTDEDKYRWRKSVGDAEYEDTPDDRRRIKHKWGKNGTTYTVKQVRTQPADLENTVLKMGKKRAFVDLALTATAASEFFTQDIDKLDPELRAAVAAERAAGPSDPFAPPAAPVDVDCEVVSAPPAEQPVRRSPPQQVHDHAKSVGLTWDDVKAVVNASDVSHDSRTWKATDVKRICEGLDARAADKQPDPPPADEPDPHYNEARRLAKELDATDEEWGAACVETFPEGVPVPMSEADINRLIGALERQKGM